jgi:2-polyprenyl-3-methyl-5-hydroxy-6-metoxy-1,4-benzoquinol methylase
MSRSSLSPSSRHAAAEEAPPTPVVVCAHCGSTRSHVRYTFPDVEKVIRECSACHLMVLDPMPTEEELHAVYNEGYFENENLAQSDVTKVYGYVDYIEERINKQKNYVSICRTLQRLAIPAHTPPRLLDYGCGLGFFLDTAFEADFEPNGVEFNQYALDYVRRRYAYRVFHFSDLDPAESYDVITMFDVVEHLREPFATIGSIRNMLAENGIVVILTMDSTSFMSRIMGKRLEDFRRIREHLFFFSRSNLVSFLVKQGFDVLKVESHGHSFELRLLATRLRTVLPVVGVPLIWLLKIFPFISNWSVYLDPRTKFIVYARKRREPRLSPPPGALLSIVVPVFNEAATIERVLTELLAIDVGMRKEIIVVDDGSTDATPEMLERWAGSGDIRVIRQPSNRGKGAAVAAGVSQTRGHYVIIQDADTEYDPKDMLPLLGAMFETGALAVYGSRFAGRYRRTGGFLPTVANRILTFAANLVNDLNLSDLMTGYKLFDGALIRSLALKSPGFAFEAEVTCRIARIGVPIVEAPITYKARTYIEGKKIRARDGWRVLSALARYGLFRAD